MSCFRAFPFRTPPCPPCGCKRPTASPLPPIANWAQVNRTEYVCCSFGAAWQWGVVPLVRVRLKVRVRVTLTLTRTTPGPQPRPLCDGGSIGWASQYPEEAEVLLPGEVALRATSRVLVILIRFADDIYRFAGGGDHPFSQMYNHFPQIQHMQIRYLFCATGVPCV